MENNNKTFDDLIDLMLSQATRFLEEMGEFFPYGSILKSDTTLGTLGVYNDDDDDFNATKAIDIFSNDIKKSINNNEILIGAIGIDVVINGNENAIMIKATNDGEKWHERCFPYTLKDNIVEIQR